jgi:hypothetical protein
MIETRMHTFVPSLVRVGAVEAVVPMEAIIAEPMLWSATWAFAREHGGPLTQGVLDVLEAERDRIDAVCAGGRHAVIDTESQDLMAGQYPSIPGWHCDAITVPRPGEDGDHQRRVRETIVYSCSVSSQPGGVSQTLFAAEPLTLEVDLDHVWPSVHRGAEDRLLRREKMRDGEVVRFDGATLHRSAACHRSGWRYWFRLTLYHKPPQNVIKRRVQVYTPVESRG